MATTKKIEKRGRPCLNLHPLDYKKPATASINERMLLNMKAAGYKNLTKFVEHYYSVMLRRKK